MQAPKEKKYRKKMCIYKKEKEKEWSVAKMEEILEVVLSW